VLCGPTPTLTHLTQPNPTLPCSSLLPCTSYESRCYLCCHCFLSLLTVSSTHPIYVLFYYFFFTEATEQGRIGVCYAWRGGRRPRRYSISTSLPLYLYLSLSLPLSLSLLFPFLSLSLPLHLPFPPFPFSLHFLSLSFSSHSPSPTPSPTPSPSLSLLALFHASRIIRSDVCLSTDTSTSISTSAKEDHLIHIPN
jgi:hypothetical protein